MKKCVQVFKRKRMIKEWVSFIAMLLLINVTGFAQIEKPGPTNTGYSGTLTSASVGTITVDGTVIENVSTGNITVKANNVTIRNCKISGGIYGINCNYGYTGLVIEDCEIVNFSSAAVYGSNFTIRRCNLHESGNDALKPITNCLVESCWIHHLGTADGSHADGVQTRSGGSNMTFRYNNFDMPKNAPAPYKSNTNFIIEQDGGPITNLLIEYNWLNGGNYPINIDDGIGGGVTVRNNWFGRDYGFGLFSGSPIRSCNVWEDTGLPIPGEAACGPVPVATPTISPAEGTYTGSVIVSMSTVTTGASIYYTTDGSPPTEASTLYTQPITITSSTTFTAKAFKTDQEASSVQTAAYTIVADIEAPIISSVANTTVTNQVIVEFNEAVTSASAENIANYSIDNGISISSATLGADQKSVTLAVSTLSTSTDYTLTVNNIEDLSNNIIAANSTAIFQYINAQTSSATWQTFAATNQTGVFTAGFDAIPNNNNMDGVMGILNGTAAAYGNLACIVRFNTGGTIDARNGSAYTSDNTISYSAGTSYHFRLEINIPNHTYDIYVTPADGSEQIVGSNYAFRTEQASVTSLDSWAIIAASGTCLVGNMTFNTGGTTPVDPTAINLDQTILNINVGGCFDLTETVLPTNATDKSVTWSSANENIATVDTDGLVCGVAEGTATITATTVNGLTATCDVTVTDIPLPDGYYCDPVNGSMANNGSQTSPWSSLEDVINAGKTFVDGDVIYLMNGNHGFPVITENNTADVTITKAPGQNPVLYRLKFTGGANHWVVKDVEISTNGAQVPVNPPLEHPVYAVYENTLLTIDGADNILVEDCYINSINNATSWTANDWNYHAWNGLYHQDADGVTIRNCHFKNVCFGMHNAGGTSISNTLYEYNTIENYNGDGMRGHGVNTVIQYNVVKNVYHTNGNHCDMIQVVGTTTGLILRGNQFLMYTDPNQPFNSGAQAIGFFDGMYYDFVIENNVIFTDHYHGITLLGAQNCKIINNTVIDENDNSLWIKIDAHKDGTPSTGNIVRNNLCSKMSTSSSVGSVDNNMIVPYADRNSYFTNFDYANFSLKAGSPAIDAGSASSAPTIDINGITRPQGNGIDVGAYEFGNLVPETNITVLPETMSIEAGSTGNLSYTLEPANATTGVNWISSDPNVAIVNSLGEVSALSIGTTTITAITNNLGLTDNCVVTVTEPPYPYNVALSKPVTVTAEDGPTPGTNLVNGDISDNGRWSADGFPQSATIDLGNDYDITSIELYTYLSRAYQYTVEASTDGTNYTQIVNRSANATTTQPITDAVTANARYIKITVTGADGYAGTWVSLNELAVMGKLASSTPVNNIPTIDAISDITVLDNAGQQTVNLSGISDGDGNTQTVSVNAASSDISIVNNVSVNYTSGNSTGTLNYTPVAEGTSTITVTVTDDGGTVNGGVDTKVITFDIVVELSCPEVTSVSITCPSNELNINDTYQSTATVLPANACDLSVSWSSNDEAVATVDANGLVTAVDCGTATITVTTNDGAYTATCDVTVNVPVTGVTLSDASLTLDEGQTANLTETVSPANACDAGVVWSSSDANVAAVDANGLVTALSSGNATITVTTNDGGYTATSLVTVIVPVTGVTLSSTSITLEEGQTDDLDETVIPANATNKLVTWSSDNPSVATVDASGLVTAIAVGSAIITVTTIDGGFTATCDVTVIEAATNLALNKPITVSAYQDDAYGYKPGENLVDGDVSDDARWSASGFPQWAEIDLGANYDLNQIDLYPYLNRAYQYIVEAKTAGGSYTTIVDKSANTESADLFVSPVNITARYVKISVSGLYGSASTWVSLSELEVWGTVSSTVPVTGVSLSATTLDLDAGQTADLDETVSPADATDKTVLWSSNNLSVATVNASGLVTAVDCGTATITVTTNDGAYTATCDVTVNVPVTGVTLSDALLTLDEGQTANLTETVSPANACDASVVWSTSDASVATVNASGLVTAVDCGTATITITTNDGAYAATCDVTVNVPVTGVTLSDASLTLDEGQTANLTETVSPANACDVSVVWTSNNEAVATVDASGLVTAVTEGTATITVTTNDGGYTANCAVTVSTPVEIWDVITYDDFESGWGSYSDGGGDCYLYTGGTYAHQGNNAGQIQDNQDNYSTFYYTNSIDLSSYSQLKIEFWFYGLGMDDGHDFFVEYSDDGGSSWQIVATFVQGSANDFVNGQFYSVTAGGNFEGVIINDGSYSFTSNAKIRFRCDGMYNDDQVYIDEVKVSATTSASSSANITLAEQKLNNGEAIISIYPNPLSGNTLNIKVNGYDEANIVIYDLMGKTVYNQSYDNMVEQSELSMPVNNLNNGIYIISVNGEQQKLVVE